MVGWLAYTIRTINIVRQQARCLGWKGGKGGKTGLSEHSKVTLPLSLLHDTQTMGRRNERQTTGCSNCMDLAVAINRTPVSGNVMKSVPARARARWCQGSRVHAEAHLIEREIINSSIAISQLKIIRYIPQFNSWKAFLSRKTYMSISIIFHLLKYEM